MSSKKIWWMLPLLALAACGSGNQREYDSAANKVTDNAAGTTPATKELSAGDTVSAVATAAPAKALPPQKVIRTADFRCKVNSVLPVVTQLEHTVQRLGGSVQESRIENNASELKTIYYKPDSMKQMQTYTTTAWLTLRVPALQLDSVINAIPGMVSFIDARTIRQNNVTLQYTANELRNEAAATATTGNAMRLAKKTGEALQAEEYETGKTDIKINRQLENMALLSNVIFATLTIQLEQPTQAYVQIIANNDHMAQVPFGAAAGNAMTYGWNVITSFMLGLISIWPFLLLAAAGWAIYRKSRQRRLLLTKE